MQYLTFIDKLFPKKRHDWILNDEDLITPEQSETRLIWFGIAFIFIFSLVILAQFVHIIVIFLPGRSLETNQNFLAKRHFFRNFPLPHIATVSENGEVYDFSLVENISPSKGFLFKLAKAKHYYVFSDPKGILYFVDCQLKKDLTQFHQNLSKQGHQVLPKSVPSSHEDIDYGIKIGGKGGSEGVFIQSLFINGFLWLFGLTKIYNDYIGPGHGSVVYPFDRSK